MEEILEWKTEEEEEEERKRSHAETRRRGEKEKRTGRIRENWERDRSVKSWSRGLKSVRTRWAFCSPLDGYPGYV
jgi:hypothetical protein